MSNNSIEERVKKIITEQLGVTLEQVTNDASFVEDLGADSLRYRRAGDGAGGGIRLRNS